VINEIFVFVFFFFGGTGVLTQGTMLARQTLCHMRLSTSPFCAGYF
jgi:ABC-type arginine transport system permease subunit